MTSAIETVGLTRRFGHAEATSSRRRRASQPGSREPRSLFHLHRTSTFLASAGGGSRSRLTVYPLPAAQLELTIAEDGTVSDVKVLRSIPLLDAAAVAAARKWRYVPTHLNGKPVPVIMTAAVEFDQ